MEETEAQSKISALELQVQELIPRRIFNKTQLDGSIISSHFVVSCFFVWKLVNKMPEVYQDDEVLADVSASLSMQPDGKGSSKEFQVTILCWTLNSFSMKCQRAGGQESSCSSSKRCRSIKHGDILTKLKTPAHTKPPTCWWVQRNLLILFAGGREESIRWKQEG